MNRYILFLLPVLAFSSQISIERVQLKPMGKIVRANAQITQLSDQKQKIVSRLRGHVEKYFVTTGEYVHTGERVALIESIELSKMSAKYVALRQQVKAAKEKLATAEKLYMKGLTSQNELNQIIIESEDLLAKQNTLESQLNSLGIKASEVKGATDQFILYAHADGVVGEIFVPLHSNVNAEDTLMSVINQGAYYAVAYLSVDDAMKVTGKTTGFVTVAGKKYPAHFVQLLPTVDEETQRAKVLFRMKEHPGNMLINAFTQMEISLEPSAKSLIVKRSSLSLFRGEWVVFVETEHGEERMKEEGHGDHAKEEAEEEKESAHDHEAEKEHEGEHDEAPYRPKVVKIIAFYGDDVAVEGVEEGELYVSKGVYFVKSMLLKSSLGGHGH
ncbi:efflux RND transporter periplasmic adaptor subunit [Sulfurovum sp. ST-21]|uniref:Efflux RND transporter periplasmic adaptor subunit n=1 Tax=Sulfurovum indicum TaxID=2779528 RepID=A0A7M1S171_9BACT|nr:efflux RND transporter periplasmic adaptor subunit [Sulfurovum indicum]QOR61116.1 efflux RND transporter periplasmic adaptor subunit [Sulfurovum indicum]